jgi:hypothetical protein
MFLRGVVHRFQGHYSTRLTFSAVSAENSEETLGSRWIQLQDH